MVDMIFCLILILAITILIMSESFKDGIIVKTGLILIALGYIGIVSQIYQGNMNLLKSVHCIGFGILVCIFGVFIRGYIRNDKQRRISDYLDKRIVK
jgi:membrane-bound ClpP family serine protease